MSCPRCRDRSFADLRRRVVGLYEALHSVGVVQRDVELRHLRGLRGQCSDWRLIDFDNAIEVTPSTAPTVQDTTSSLPEPIVIERSDVNEIYGLSPAIWSGAHGRSIMRDLPHRKRRKVESGHDIREKDDVEHRARSRV